MLRYGISEKYDSHEDVGELSTVSGQQLAKDGKQREATALLYLTDVEEGGETVFPTSQWEDPEAAAARGPFSACGARGVAAKPKKGDMLVFWSINAEGGVDHGALHAGCPVLKGEKWTATKVCVLGAMRMVIGMLAVVMVVVVLSPHCRKPCDIPRTSVMPCYMCSTELPWYLFASLPALPFIPRPSAVQEPCYAWPRLVAALA